MTIEIETHPGGTEGDNLVKTRLATGEMTDIFYYNSGSLLQALNPAETLVDLSGEPFIANIAGVVPADRLAGRRDLRRPDGARPWAAASSTTRRSTATSGLEVPKTWAEFAANNETIKAAGIAPVVRHVRRHLDLAAVRARRLLQRRRRPCPTSPSSTPPTRPTTPTRPRRWPASSTCRRRSRRAGGRRTSASTSTRTA